MDTDRWLVRPRTSSPAGVGAWQLYCFPHAGGGTSMYSAWAGELAPAVELTAICPPGRERHVTVPPHRTMSELVEQLVAVLAPVVRTPFAFFGHSLGALVAFEVARELWRRGNGPAHLIASASRPPHVPGRVEELCRLDDTALVAELTRLGGIPDGLGDEPAVLKLVLPALRADLGIAARYLADPGDPLPSGITAIGGTGDRGLDAGTMLGWRRQTAGPFVRRMLPGGHFYLIPRRREVLDAIRRDLPAQPAELAVHHHEEAAS